MTLDSGFHLNNDTDGYAPLARRDRRAYMAFLRGVIADLPQPDAMIAHMDLRQMAALRSAWRTQDPDNHGCFCVNDKDAELLRPLGLVAVNSNFLGAWAMQVRARLLELEQ